MNEYEHHDATLPALGDMTAAEFRRYGHELIDWISRYLEHAEEYPVLAQVAPGELRARLPNAPPERGEAMNKIIADIDRYIAPALTHWNSPNFFAYFSISSSAPGIFGELLCAAFNVNAMLWRTSPAATELEEVALDWLREMIRLPESFDGIIYDTASVSTMHAIAAARENLGLEIRERGMTGRELPPIYVYASEQAHSSIEKALIALGLGQRSLRKVKTDAEFRMDAAELARLIAEDKAAGALPCCVIATVGTTSTTSIDPVGEIARMCQEQNVWLHVDAAYGGSAAIVPEMRSVLDGCGEADSLVTNPHKWLFTPLDLSVLYSRRMNVLRQAFSLVPEYLRTDEATDEVRNGMDYGIQLGRRFRALKLWMVMRYFGHEGLANRIREHCRLAQEFRSWIEEANDWEILAPTPFSTVCFRFAPPELRGDAARLDELNERIMQAVNESGKAFLSHTRLHNRFTLRLAIGNIRTTEDHVRRAWQLLQAEAARHIDSQ